MAPLRGNPGRVSRCVDRRQVHRYGRSGFEENAETDVLTVGGASLDAAAMIREEAGRVSVAGTHPVGRLASGHGGQAYAVAVVESVDPAD